MADLSIRVRVPEGEQTVQKLQAIQQQMAGVGATTAATATSVKATTGAWGGMIGTLGTLRGLLYGTGALIAGRAVVGWATYASAVNDANNAFVRLTSARGLAGGRKLLEQMNQSVSGLLDPLERATTANQLFMSGVTSAADMQTAIMYARTLSETYGRDLSESIQMVTEAMRSMRSTSLRSIGIEAAVADEIDQVASATGRKAASMTEAERRAIALNLTMREMKKTMADIGPITNDVSDSIREASNAWKELKVTLGEMLAPAFQALIEEITERLRGKGPGWSFAGGAKDTALSLLAAPFALLGHDPGWGAEGPAEAPIRGRFYAPTPGGRLAPRRKQTVERLEVKSLPLARGAS